MTIRPSFRGEFKAGEGGKWGGRRHHGSLDQHAQRKGPWSDVTTATVATQGIDSYACLAGLRKGVQSMTMSTTQNEQPPHSTASSPDEAGPTGMPTGLAVLVAVFGFVVMALTLLVKYLITGTAVRDGLGWVLLSLSIVFGLAMPIAVWRRNHRKKEQ